MSDGILNLITFLTVLAILVAAWFSIKHIFYTNNSRRSFRELLKRFKKEPDMFTVTRVIGPLHANTTYRVVSWWYDLDFIVYDAKNFINGEEMCFYHTDGFPAELNDLERLWLFKAVRKLKERKAVDSDAVDDPLNNALERRGFK